MGGNHLGRCLEHCFLEKLQDAGAHLSACDLLHLMEFDHIQVNEADLPVFP
jgi:ssRNA-specific RNase YbeY (16S rRNA maturation enzyme)